MKDLKSLMRNTQEIEVPFFDEELEGFVVNLAYVSKDEIKNISDECKKTTFDRKTHKPKETIDTDKFQRLFCDAAVIGWTGLKLKYLKDLLLVDVSGFTDLEEELEYSQDNAYDLISNSQSFDSFVSEVLSDINFFNKS